MAQTTIKLINGGEIIPLGMGPFQNPAHRVDPSTLPDLPAGVTIKDLVTTLWEWHKAEKNDNEATLLSWEIKVREIGYLPQYGPDGFDQFGYDQNDTDAEGRDRMGFTPEDRAADPMLADTPRTASYAAGTELPDQRSHNQGKYNNRGNPAGAEKLSTDGTRRPLNRCWHDILIANEAIPVQDRLTDEEIVEKLQKLFSGKIPQRSVRKTRWEFNRGELPCQRNIKPIVVSYRYVKAGNSLYRTTPRGRVLETWDLTDVNLGRAMKPEANG